MLASVNRWTLVAKVGLDHKETTLPFFRTRLVLIHLQRDPIVPKRHSDSTPRTSTPVEGGTTAIYTSVDCHLPSSCTYCAVPSILESIRRYLSSYARRRQAVRHTSAGWLPTLCHGGRRDRVVARSSLVFTPPTQAQLRRAHKDKLLRHRECPVRQYILKRASWRTQRHTSAALMTSPAGCLYGGSKADVTSLATSRKESDSSSVSPAV